MKTLIALYILIFTTSAFANKYDCIDGSGNHLAELQIFNNNEIQWSQFWNSAESDGRFIGAEDAPFSEFKGYLRFRLTDFFTTESSMHVLAVEKLNEQFVKAATYFDNDDHAEDITHYTCEKKN